MSSSFPVITELPVTDDLRNKCGVTRFVKEGPATLVLMCGGGSSSSANNNKDDQENKKTTIIIFHVQKGGFFDTVEDFGKASKGKLDQQTQEAIKFCLAQGEYPELIMKNGNSSSSSTSDDNCSDGTNHQAEEAANGGGTGVTTAADCIVVDPSKDLDPYIPDRNYVEFAIRTAKKTVKQEDSLVRQLFYVGLSAKSQNPLCLGIMAPTSEGKTYAVTETIVKYFPPKDVWKIGSMSPKVIIRQSGVLVDGDTLEPIESEIRDLEMEIKQAEDENQKERLKDELKNMVDNSKCLIDLTGKILVFFEPPRPETWDILKPMLSHDVLEMEHPFVDRTEVAGITVKKIVTRGWPACIFCSARDESRWDVWPEIQSRFIITSPNMSGEKYRQSNMLTAQKMSLPGEIQEQIIVSSSDVELAKKCVSYLQQQVTGLSSSSSQNPGLNQNEEKKKPVWIPYGLLLGETMQSNRGADMRSNQRLFSLLNIVPLAKANIRKRLVYGRERLVVAAVEDLVEILNITKNVTGVPSHKVRFLKEVLIPLYNKRQPDEKEKVSGVTTKELCDFYREKWHRAISTDNLRKQYLNELVVNDLVGETESQVDKRQYIYYPLIELEDNYDSYDKKKQVVTVEAAAVVTDEQQKQKITKLPNEARFDNFLHYPSIKLPKNCKEIPERWLIFEILRLAIYRIQTDQYQGLLGDFLRSVQGESVREGGNGAKGLQLLDENGSQMTVTQFCAEYEAYVPFTIRYIFRADSASSYNKIFDKFEYLGTLHPELCKKLSNEARFDNFVISSDEKLRHTMAAAAVANNNNIRYSQEIFLKKIIAERSNVKTYHAPESTDQWDTSIDNNGDRNGKNQAMPSLSSSAALDGLDTVKPSENDGKNTGGAENTSINDTDPSITQSIPKPIVSAEDFFHDAPDLSWQPLPAHTLEQSPCHPIIVNKGRFYYCKVHPKEVRSIYLETIEQHCKYKDPDLHKEEILRLSSMAGKDSG